MKIFIIIYLLLIHIFIAITLVTPDVSLKISQKMGWTKANNEFIPYYHAQLVSFQARIDKNTLKKSIFFIGDSLIQGLAVNTIHNKSVNYGIGWDTTNGVLQRIPEYTSLLQAKLVIIAVGINDLKQRNNQEIQDNYIKISQLIPKNIPILFSAVLPVNEDLTNRSKLNQRIQQLNQMLHRFTKSSARLYFINISSVLTDTGGNLLNAYHIGDGLHLNAAGYSLWIAAIKTKIAEIFPYDT